MYLQTSLWTACTASFIFFFFNDTATTEIYTLSPTRRSSDLRSRARWSRNLTGRCVDAQMVRPVSVRSEEHTAELQSPYDVVCRLRLEKKKCDVVAVLGLENVASRRDADGRGVHR